MKRSITENKNMTFDDVIRLFVYRPYNDVLEYMVDADERIHFRGDTWMVILDHKTGDFYFSGELHKYYSIDTIESIRDCFGDIYSVFNLKYDEVVKDRWMMISDDVPGDKSYKSRFADKEKKKLMLQQKKEYYLAHKEEINNKQKEYYKKKKRFA